MARHIRKQFPGAKYHVTNRGNGRQEIFAESGDSDRFVEQLKAFLARLGLARWFLVELACTLGGLTQRAVADYFGGVMEHAIGKARQRLHLRLATDDKVRKKWENLRDGMSIV